MKIQFNRQRMFDLIQKLGPIVPERHPKAAMTHIELTVTESSAELVATNSDTTVCCQLAGVEVESPGKVLLPLRRTQRLLNNCTEAAIGLETPANFTGVRFTGSGWEVDLDTPSPDEYPAGELIELGESFYIMSAESLHLLVNRTVFAIDEEITRYALGGVKLELVDNTVIGIGTDGRRLAAMEVLVDSRGTPDPIGDLIIRADALQMIDRLLTTAEVRFASCKDGLLIESPTFSVHSETLEGKFPQWRDVIRKDATQDTIIEMPAGRLMSAAKRAAVATSEEKRGLEIELGKGDCTLCAETYQVGRARVTLPIPYDGELLLTCLDPRLLNDFLGKLHPECDFRLGYNSEDKAVECRTDDGYTYILMPIARDK